MEKMKRKQFSSLFSVFLFLFFALILLGCEKQGDLISGKALFETKAKERIIPSEIGPDPLIYFCIEDNCSSALESIVLSAKKSVHCAFYDLDLENIISALGKRSKEIDVKVVLDDEPYKGEIKGEGIRIQNISARMHNKFCIIDSQAVWMGSFNPTHNDNEKNSNNAILLSSVYLSKDYEAEFNELWNGVYGGGSKIEYPKFTHNQMLIEAAFCPEDGCEKLVAEKISKAENSIYSMVFSFTSEQISDAIVFNSKADYLGIFDNSQAGSKYSQFHRLNEFGLEVKRKKGGGKLHHKVFILDNQTVVTGSYNPTGSGSDRNDESVLIIHDRFVAKAFAEEFFSLWNQNQ